ncbi:MAG TPA: hypothetical protein VJN93_00520 [Candidatus Acidoferrum sp.]|nr:hypothetical protein [Candidatus Acidoferrum sp.]
MSWLPLGDHDPGWFLRWLSLFGIGLFGLGFLVGSLVAPRNPRLGGILFLVFLPVAAFCLAYPESGFLVWHSDGGGYFETPLPWTAVGLTLLFFTPFVVPLFALSRKKRAAIVFAVAVLIAIPVFARSRWTPVLLPQLLLFACPFLLFGLFWLGTHRLRWPILIQSRPRRLTKRIAGVVFACLAILCADVAITFVLAALGSSLFSGDCRGKPPFTHAESPYHAVFTARAIYVGLSLRTMLQSRNNPNALHDPRVGEWAIGVVQERFWGVPQRWPHLVLMTDFVFWKGETYFIDGSREHGLLSNALPIVGARVNCSRSRPVKDAVVDLRVLRQPPADVTRIIGYVRQPGPYGGFTTPPTTPKFLAGARVNASGPTGTISITTDASGIYQFDGLPAGDYTVQLTVPKSQVAGQPNLEASPAEVHLRTNGLVERNLDLYWNGRIEGHVRDGAGKPARVYLTLRTADQSHLPLFSPRIDSSGFYQISKIPPGRYFVVANEYGPNDQSPYDVQYYRSTSDARNAQVLQLGPGQRIRGIDFALPRLAERTVHVQVTRPDGRGAAGVPICVAYEHTENFARLSTASWIKDTDQSGFGIIHVYGNSRVRVFAAQYVENEKTKHNDLYYSLPIEATADKVPENVQLVLASRQL